MEDLKTQYQDYLQWQADHPNAVLIESKRSDGNIEQRFRDAAEIFVAIVDAPKLTFFGRIKGLWLH